MIRIHDFGDPYTHAISLTYISKIVTELTSPKNNIFTFEYAGKQRLLYNGKSIDLIQTCRPDTICLILIDFKSINLV